MTDAAEARSKEGEGEPAIHYGNERRRPNRNAVFSPNLIGLARSRAEIVRDAAFEHRSNQSSRGSMLPIALAVVAFWGAIVLLAF